MTKLTLLTLATVNHDTVTFHHHHPRAGATRTRPPKCHKSRCVRKVMQSGQEQCQANRVAARRHRPPNNNNDNKTGSNPFALGCSCVCV